MTEVAAPTATPAATAPAPEAKVKPPKDEQHGVTRPKVGTSTGAVWVIADDMSAAGKPADRKDVLAAAIAGGLNASTAATQYGRWRKYHGLGAEPKTVAAVAAASDVSAVAA